MKWACKNKQNKNLSLNLLAKSKVPIAQLFQLVNGHADISAAADILTPQATMDERANARAEVILARDHLVIFLEDLFWIF